MADAQEAIHDLAETHPQIVGLTWIAGERPSPEDMSMFVRILATTFGAAAAAMTVMFADGSRMVIEGQTLMHDDSEGDDAEFDEADD